jgi:hypothetical protein
VDCGENAVRGCVWFLEGRGVAIVFDDFIEGFECERLAAAIGGCSFSDAKFSKSKDSKVIFWAGKGGTRVFI